jgi:glyoxylase I family protein
MPDTPPFRLKGIDHVVLRIVDLDQSMHFYRDILGCAVERERAEIGLYQLRAGGTLIDLVPIDEELGSKGGAAPGRQGHNMDHFAIGIDPFDEEALRAYLGEHGIDVPAAALRYGAEGEGPSVYITDPDGNLVELKAPVKS